MKRYEYRIETKDLPPGVAQWVDAVCGMGEVASMDAIVTVVAVEAEDDYDAAMKAREIEDCLVGTTNHAWRLPKPQVKSIRQPTQRQHWKAWSRADTDELRRLLDMDWGPSDIGRRLGRSLRSVESAIGRMKAKAELASDTKEAPMT